MLLCIVSATLCQTNTEKTINERDTIIVNNLIQQSKKYFTDSPALAINLSTQAKSLAEKIPYPKGEASYDGSTLKTSSINASTSSVRCSSSMLTMRTTITEVSTVTTDSSLLKNTKIKTVNTSTEPVIKVSNQSATTANNSTTVATINVEKATESSVINIYPNPVINKAIIYFGNDQINKPEIILMDTYGKSYLLRNVKIIGKNAIEIDLSGISSGMYFIRIQFKNGIKVYKLIKE